MSALLQLAERCEKAAADAQGELLHEAWRLVHGRHYQAHPGYGRFQRALGAEAFLDAAMQLVPNAYYWSAGTIAQEGYEHYDDMDFGWAQVVHRERGNHIDCEAAATPALALAAAALRARAAS